MAVRNPGRGLPGLGLALAILLGLGACSWSPPGGDQSHQSSVPINTPEPVTRTQRHPEGDYSPVLLTARRMLGTPYQYGGHTPDQGFDCSGLVYFAHRSHGLDVPRTARAQFDFAAPVSYGDMRPGDLMFFRTRGKQVSHVGFYLGPGRFLHAPGTGKQVSVADYRSTYWRARFAGAGRIRR